MKKLFEALAERHPGCEVVDVRFTFDHSVNDQFETVEMFDENLAEAIQNAEEIDIETAFG